MKGSFSNRFAPQADGWVHLAPPGEHGHAEAGPQVIDARTTAAMVANFKGPLLVDYEHESHDPEKRTTAAGWIEEVRGDAQGLWGRVRWSEAGEMALATGEYRFISPVWSGEQRDGKFYPDTLLDAGLTNQPNLKGLRPLSNRSAARAAANEEPTKQGEPMKRIANKLGLHPDAAEEAVETKVAEIMARAESAEGKVQALTTERDELKNRVATLLDEQVEADLDAAGIKDEAKRNRLKPVLAAVDNREGRKAIIADLKPDASPATGPQTNRAAAKQPATAAANSDDPKARAEAQEAEVQAYRAQNRCSYADARNAVRRAKPELFGLRK
jgi:phage I-like protein